MSFSTAVILNDVDDYIAPSKACIKPVKIDTTYGRTTVIRVEQDGTYTGVSEDGVSRILPKATISLNDCLACSGCITTSESVLISAHGVEAFLQFVRRNREQSEASVLLAISISPQSIASLSSELTKIRSSPDVVRWFEQLTADTPAHQNASLMERTRLFLIKIFHSLGAHIVVDTTLARNLSLLESAAEFVDRFRKSSDLPIFCSVCPGWICYAEKAALGHQNRSKSSLLIHHLSTVRSPQQICGRLLKQVDPQSVYHVSVMPCFDKKLEASRSEFSTSLSEPNGQNIPDVDLVLATNELLELLKTVCPVVDESSTDTLLSGPPVVVPSIQKQLERLTALFSHCLINFQPSCRSALSYRHPGSGSGGYADFVFRYTARELFRTPIADDMSSDPRVLIRPLANRDMQEWLLFATEDDRNASQIQLDKYNSCRTPYRLLKCEPKPLLVFAVANGFRNIQNIIQPLKTLGKTQAQGKDTRSACYPFDYVEVMACPGGCLNGGGQLKHTFDDSKEAYFNLPVISPSTLSAITGHLYDFLNQFDPEHKTLRTTYREVPTIEIINPSVLQW